MKDKTLVKRIIATALSLIMVIGLLPFSAFAAGSNGSTSSSLDDLLNINDAPGEFKNTDNPYGFDEGVPFNLAPQDELLYFYSGFSNDFGFNNQWSLKYDIYQGIKPGTHLNGWRTNLGSSIKSGNNSFKTWGFVQAVSFDPYGTGRNTHLAYIGLDSTNDSNWSFRVNVINLTTNRQAYETRKIGNANWIKNETQEDGFENFNASNFLSITAGDYDGDGKDTIVVFASTDGTTSTLKEYYLSDNDNNGEEKICDLGSSNSLLHWTYQHANYGGSALANSKIAAQKLQADLATGDVDGDNKDDLAVVSYIGDIDKNTVDDTTRSMFFAYLGIARGSGSGKSIVNKGSMNSELDVVARNNYKKDDDEIADLTMASPSVAIGDVDGDGLDEVVVAGYGVDVWHEGGDIAKQVKLSENSVVVGIYEATRDTSNGKTSRLLFKQFKYDKDTDSPINTMTNDIINSLKDNFNEGGEVNHEVVMPQFQVATVATNGQGAAQDIFLNGTFVTYNVSGTLDYKYQSAFVDKDDGSSHNMDVRFSFITHMSVGVYDSNNAGREQIAYVVAQKDGGSNIYSGGNHDDYAYMVAVSGGSSYDDKTAGGKIVSYGGVKGYSTSGLDGDYNSEDDYEFHDVGIPKDSTKNLVLVAVDIDNDGTVGKYIGKEYTYTDPNVLAVLQAPPYFDELKEGGYGDAGTTYAFTTSYTIGQTSGNTSSFSVGISSEVAVPGLKVAIGSGYNGTWEEEFTEAFTESFTTIFTATSENMVVMQRTPVIIYKYLLQDKNGKFPSTGGEFGANGNVMTIAVPAQPVYALATVDEYNGYVDKYTDMMKSVDKNEYTPMNTVKKIGDQYLKDNEGDPSAYRPNWSGGTAYGNLTSVTPNTGVITSEYSASSEQTQEKSSSHGFYFDMTVSAGAIAVVGEVWAGVSAGTEHNWSQGSFTTTTTTTTTSGSVANLGESGLDPNILKNYGFNWQFGKWEINIGNGKTPVYGYSVNTIRTGAPVPQNLTVEDAVTPAGGEAAKLTWDAINGATYKVYLLNDGASPTVFKTDDASYTYEIPADTRRHSFTFQVSTVVGDQESVLSSSVTYYRKSYGMSAYDIAVQNGFEGTEEEWLASLIGTDGIDGVGVEKAEINENGELIIILTDGTQIDLGTVVGATGEAGVGIVSVYINSDGELEILLTDGSEMNLGTVIGKDGADGITPQLRINAETNEWEVSLDDGVTWETTGVKATGDKGDKGEQGDPGVGIETVELDTENSDETKSVYIITLTDGYTYSFTVNHGEDGATGAKGNPGANGITPQLRINSETNEWEVSLDTAHSFSALTATAKKL